ncbi:hypothetical protein GCM10023340_26550 [Nocardioides marinquilinus]|uniref:N-acetylmuramic acid 6-phosphate etherase n=1 Tax=Nocardioides marinquilinus TaxID=1210400 RepID=A0ABP9PS96_9ACTN
MSGLTVGVDLGKTGCRALADDGRHAEGAGSAGLADAGGVDAAVAAVGVVLAQLDGPVETLCVAAAGSEASPDGARRLGEALGRRGAAVHVAVTSDSIAAHAGALAGEPGSVVAVGTGVAALVVTPDGAIRRLDGWGPWLGDDGGGAWIAREALRGVLLAREGRGRATALTAAAEARFGDLAHLPHALSAGGTTARTAAAFVPDVLAAAEGGDDLARDVVTRAGAVWAGLAVAGGDPQPVLVGGLAEAPALVAACTAALPEGYAVRPGRGTPVEGALLLATRTDLPHEAAVLRLEPAASGPRDDVDLLATEQVRADLTDLDARTPDELVGLLLEAEATVPAALAATRPALARAVVLAAEALDAGGRLVYVGAGTPGRLAALDAAECPPTFGVDPSRVVAVTAGGEGAARTAVEGAEDDADAGARDLAALGVTASDLVVGIAASGRTPYVLAALDHARAAGAATVAIVNNAASPAAARADVAVEALTGPETLGGSTRLKAGTAQKVALNVLSTAAMITVGHVYGAWMVDVSPSNEKLRRRARRILREATGATDEAALAALEASGWRTKTALVTLLTGLDAAGADALLAAHGGRARAALAAASASQRQEAAS